jgi:hypothetical protein
VDADDFLDAPFVEFVVNSVQHEREAALVTNVPYKGSIFFQPRLTRVYVFGEERVQSCVQRKLPYLESRLPPSTGLTWVLTREHWVRTSPNPCASPLRLSAVYCLLSAVCCLLSASSAWVLARDHWVRFSHFSLVGFVCRP